MAEINVDTLHADVEHLKTDVIDIKMNAKELTAVVATMRDNSIRTEIYLSQMREGQDKISKDATENARKAEENVKKTNDKADANQAANMRALQAMKDEKPQMWKKLGMAWKVAIITVTTGLLGSYIFGTIQYFLKQASR